MGVIAKRDVDVLTPEKRMFLHNWLKCNTGTFAECMEILARDMPAEFVRRYLEALKLDNSYERDRNRVSFTVEGPYDKIQALARARTAPQTKEDAEIVREEIKRIEDEEDGYTSIEELKADEILSAGYSG